VPAATPSFSPPNCRRLINTRDWLWPKLFRAQPVGRFACRSGDRFNGRMAPRFLTIVTSRNLPKIWQSREAEPSTINEKTTADFMWVVEQAGILKRERAATDATLGDAFLRPIVGYFKKGHTCRVTGDRVLPCRLSDCHP
jgi:hypothetical protein